MRNASPESAIFTPANLYIMQALAQSGKQEESPWQNGGTFYPTFAPLWKTVFQQEALPCVTSSTPAVLPDIMQ